MKCPNCGSENCQYVTSYHTHTKFFSVLDACCCSLFLGPIGLICGFCGTGSDTTTKEYWICHECGEKFSPWRAQINHLLNHKDKENNSEEQNKISIRFISEENSNIDAWTAELWERFRSYYDNCIVGTDLEQHMIVRTPTVKNNILEKMEQECQNYLHKDSTVLCAIEAGDGLLLFKDGMAWKRKFISFDDIVQINLCDDIIYINQSGLRVSQNFGRNLFELLRVILPDKIGHEYESYQEMLNVLQNMKPEESNRITHYSSFPEYAAYVKWELGNCMNFFRQTDYDNYEEYITIRDTKEKLENKVYSVCIWLGIIAGILGMVMNGFGGLLWGVFLFGILPCVIMVFITVTDYWSGYKSKLLPKEISAVLEESENKDINKKGNISPVFYNEYLKGFKDENYRYCCGCGKKFKQGYSVCPYCGKKYEN